MNTSRPVPSRPLHWRVTAVALGLSALVSAPARAAQDLEVTSMSIEDLMNIEVTTVSRKAQRLTDAAAAAFVITADDIQRSGSMSIPEALRMVPGLEVAQINASRWAVTARGFNGRFANKLLVLIDGRSLYTPLYAGVYWEGEDVLLDDVDRIEVIRGPGASMWGANAVNGVISIITKHAKRTQGGLAAVQLGTQGQTQGAVRWGDQVDEDTHYRFWAKSTQRDHGQTTDGSAAFDQINSQRAGLRLDRELSGSSRFSTSANLFDARNGDTWVMPQLAAPYGVPTNLTQGNRNANVVAKYDWSLADGSQASVQASLDNTRIQMPGVLTEDRTTLDIDFQNRFALTPSQDMIWGLGYRNSRDHIETGQSLVSMSTARETQTVYSGFVHDEITLEPNRWKLMIGSKFEHNSYTGFEIQPSLRSLWNLNPTDSVWGSVSRAVRTPSRVERSVALNLVQPPSAATNGLPMLINMTADPKYGSESVLSYETGYRSQIRPGVQVDIAAFVSRFQHLRALQSYGTSLAMNGAQPYLLMSSTTANTLDAYEGGLEAALDWHVSPTWRLQGAYTHLKVHARRNGDPMHDTDAQIAEGMVPRNQISLRSSFDLGTHHQLDAWIRHVGRLGYASIPAYSALDLRWAWRVTPKLELSLAGQNLLKSQHVEYAPDQLPTVTTSIPRTASIKARWQF